MQFCKHIYTIITIYSIFSMVESRPHPSKQVSFVTLNSTTQQHESGTNITTDTSRERIRILTHPPIHRKKGSTEIFDEDLIGEQDIIFPDSIELTLEPISRLDVTPTCAEGSTFCEDIETYPYNHLREILRKTKSHNDLFGMDETPDEIANRIGEPEENYLCSAVDKTVYPKVGKTKNNKWKYIINQGAHEGYVQGVRVETCRSLNRPCDLIGNLPNGYITSCKQKFVYRRMLSISEGGQPLPDTFLMPSACCCSYKRDTRFLARFGSPTTPAK